jgi:nitrogen fixation NifU-like protein
MYSSRVLEHLDNPRHVGVLANASSKGEATNPVCGDLLHLYLQIENDQIISASFQVQGCPPSIAAGSVLTEMITGLSLDEARMLKPQDVARALETLPRNKEHCAVLAIEALQSALSHYQSGESS